MREVTLGEAIRNFSQLIDAAEGGETIVVIKNGKPAAKITPLARDRRSDYAWKTAFAALSESLSAKRATGYRVGKIEEDDNYGPV